MTKKKPRDGSGASVTSKASTAAKALPTGGLALPQDAASAITSDATSLGTATPSSDTTGSYFDQFKNFERQVDAGFINQFNKLAIHEGWSKSEKARRRDEAVELEFAHLFGTDTKDLSKWHELCRIIGIDDQGLTSITKCKKVSMLKHLSAWLLSKTNGLQALGSPKVRVNLVNLLDHLRNGTPLRTFKSFYEFQKYTLKPGRCMSRTLAKKDGFIRVFLRHVA
ncbi:hypothetical protein N0V90_009767 [Kalmusia sp. IMI 367209]|nr:hypothetical protein N0V90_009767 [Kalmusia sp. IMI 367209]